MQWLAELRSSRRGEYDSPGVLSKMPGYAVFNTSRSWGQVSFLVKGPWIPSNAPGALLNTACSAMFHRTQKHLGSVMHRVILLFNVCVVLAIDHPLPHHSVKSLEESVLWIWMKLIMQVMGMCCHTWTLKGQFTQITDSLRFSWPGSSSSIVFGWRQQYIRLGQFIFFLSII